MRTGVAARPGHRAPVRTPLLPWRDGLWLKCENEQIGGSFKYRGAYLAVAGTAGSHYVTGSSGNHGVALAEAVAALRPGADVTCFSSAISPGKVDRLVALGAELRLVPGDNDRRDEAALQFAAEVGATFVHSSDNPYMVAGAISLVEEIQNQLPAAARLVAPVGGGGLLAGLLLGAAGSGDAITVVGAEPAGASRMSMSLRRGAALVLPTADTVCEGARALRPSRLPFAIATALRPRMRSVSDELVLSARQELDSRGIRAENTAALALAAASLEDDGVPTVVILTGGNR